MKIKKEVNLNVKLDFEIIFIVIFNDFEWLNIISYEW